MHGRNFKVLGQLAGVLGLARKFGLKARVRDLQHGRDHIGVGLSRDCGEVAIEQHDVVGIDACLIERLRPVGRDVHRRAVTAQPARDRGGDPRLVLGDQQAHAQTLPSPSDHPWGVCRGQSPGSTTPRNSTLWMRAGGAVAACRSRSIPTMPPAAAPKSAAPGAAHGDGGDDDAAAVVHRPEVVRPLPARPAGSSPRRR